MGLYHENIAFIWDDVIHVWDRITNTGRGQTCLQFKRKPNRKTKAEQRETTELYGDHNTATQQIGVQNDGGQHKLAAVVNATVPSPSSRIAAILSILFGTSELLYLDNILCLKDKSGMWATGVKSGVANNTMQCVLHLKVCLKNNAQKIQGHWQKWDKLRFLFSFESKGLTDKFI